MNKQGWDETDPDTPLTVPLAISFVSALLGGGPVLEDEDGWRYFLFLMPDHTVGWMRRRP